MTTLSPGDRVTTIIGGRKEGGTVVYVRGDSVRVALPGRTVTRPIARVKRVESGACRTMADVEAYAKFAMEESGRGMPSIAAQARESALRPVPKPPKPWRSEAYRAFVRSQRSCCCCGGGPTSSDPMVAHHHGPRGMGEKACDSRCVPLLDSCHRHFHDHGVFYGVPVLQFAPLTREQTDRIAVRAQAECLRAWCEREDIGTDEAIVDALVEAIRRTK